MLEWSWVLDPSEEKFTAEHAEEARTSPRARRAAIWPAPDVLTPRRRRDALAALPIVQAGRPGSPRTLSEMTLQSGRGDTVLPGMSGIVLAIG